MSDEDGFIADIKSMSDNQLLDRAAGYNAELERGRRLTDTGEALIKQNINLFVICQNELQNRLRQRIERETDRVNTQSV